MVGVMDVDYLSGTEKSVFEIPPNNRSVRTWGFDIV